MTDARHEPVRVWAVAAEDMPAVRPRLVEVLVDCVRHGASVGFLSPLSAGDADTYWRRVERAVEEGRCVVFAAALGDGDVTGTVLLDVDTFPNQPHRATVSKLLVHSSARRRGMGEALMVELERVAAARGRWLLTLDTATGGAARLYERLGWSPAGTIPDYALNPDSTLTDTTFYWKQLSGRRGASGVPGRVAGEAPPGRGPAGVPSQKLRPRVRPNAELLE